MIDRKKLRLEIFERDDWKCFYCDVDLVSGKDPSVRRGGGGDIPNSATIDHIRPLSRQGLWEKSNIVSCCLRCNRLKSNLDLNEYRAVLCWRHKQRWIKFPGELRRQKKVAA